MPDPFRAVFDGHFDYVWCSLRRCGVREADLEDLAHEVFLRVHRQLGDYDATRPLRPWIFGFVFRVASDHRRLARHRREVPGEAPDLVDPEPAPDERLMAQDRRALVAAALDALDLEHRAIFVASEIEGHAVREVADALEIPLGTAFSRLRVAREKFAAAVRRLHVRRGEA
jgi:RNA polymerase sigma-70 factor (ECF subfamily)